MVVPELKAWRAARTRAARFTAAAKPRLARGAQAVRPRVVRVTHAVRPRLLRVTKAVSARSMRLTTLQLTAGAATLGLALSAGAVAAAGPWDSTGQRTAERDRALSHDREGGADHGRNSGTSARTSPGAPKPAPSAASVLAGLGGATNAVPAPAEKVLADLLDPLLHAPALGARPAAAVVDVATGTRLYATGQDDAVTPASTTKIATAAAVLSAAGPDHRITTRTVLQPDSDELVLVGGGDPTLTAREDAGGNASLRTLADRTAAALKKRDLDTVTLTYDTSLYEGPTLHPIGVNTNLAPVTALMADEGRLDDSQSGPADRSADPAAEAARTFAGLLADRGIRTTDGVSPSTAAKSAEPLASVSSPPLSALVERMLTNSDNDIAEALARQVAVATGEPASFEGAATALRTELKKLDLPLTGVEFADGSGLDRDDRLTAGFLTALLAKSADPAHTELRPILTGLPIAGFTGTLRNRYPTDSSGTGVVRAKTGTLTGVNTLAGTVVDTDGHLLTFAFLATGTVDPTAAQGALDEAASALAECGCS
ncbi:D-alanyl-D-alanine carboxypeptidase/D-alanyl-D-alanine endopeptidase [Streptomyces sp. NPDC002845]